MLNKLNLTELPSDQSAWLRTRCQTTYVDAVLVEESTRLGELPWNVEVLWYSPNTNGGLGRHRALGLENADKATSSPQPRNFPQRKKQRKTKTKKEENHTTRQSVLFLHCSIQTECVGNMRFKTISIYLLWVDPKHRTP